MLSWLSDHAGLLYFLLGLAAVALACCWWLTRQRKYLLGVAVVTSLAVLVWAVTLWVVTDSQQIQRTITAMAAAIGDNKPEEVVKHLASDFTYGSYTKQSAERDIRAAIQRFGLQEVRVKDVTITKLSRPDGKAEAEFRVWVFSSMAESGVPYWCKAEMVLEDQSWRLRRIRFFKGFVDTNQEVHP
jgi:hypothetical protein